MNKSLIRHCLVDLRGGFADEYSPSHTTVRRDKRRRIKTQLSSKEASGVGAKAPPVMWLTPYLSSFLAMNW